ncbi:MAG: metal-dependent hydrolase [Desulfobacterales bacterium]|nr:metal-dependent hydrolase [Desulfobacterales bacterium]
MTPAGHASVAYLAGTFLKRLPLSAILLGGVLPDIDFILLFWEGFNAVHRVWTHNLLFIILMGVIVSSRAGAGRRMIFFMGMTVGGLLHLIVDACLDNNPGNGIGIPFFWPFLDTFFSPVNLSLSNTGSAGWEQPLEMARHAVGGLLVELPFFLVCAWVFFRKKARRENN